MMGLEEGKFVITFPSLALRPAKPKGLASELHPPLPFLASTISVTRNEGIKAGVDGIEVTFPPVDGDEHK